MSASAVYFILTESGAVKIGVAADPATRLQKLQVGNHERMHLVRVIDGGFDEERWLHQRFLKHRIRGEWFAFVPEMMTVRPPDFVRRAPAPKQEARYRDIGAWISNADRLGLLSEKDRSFFARGAA